jgi:hypothetical protein
MRTVMLARLLRWLSILLIFWTANGDADFESVRTKMKKDRSGKGGDPKDKYFRMCAHDRYRDLMMGERDRVLTLMQMNLCTFSTTLIFPDQ